jgi:hypothetical protein
MNRASSLSAFRRVLRKQRRIAMMIRALRALIHFGPWRHAARRYISERRPPARRASPISLIPDLNATTIAETIHEQSVCLVERLPNAIVHEIRELTDLLPPNEYGSFNEQHPAVQRLVEDSGVLAVARTYFSAEPVLLECNLVVQESEERRLISATSQRRFHFDYAGWHSLNLFVYLTDVEADSGAHQVVVGTHKHKLVRDVVRPSLEDEEVELRFATKIRTIAGPAGTLFFEDTEAFHRRLAVKQRRVMLNILFASHRSTFSQGRLVKPHSELIATLRANKMEVTAARKI